MKLDVFIYNVRKIANAHYIGGILLSILFFVIKINKFMCECMIRNDQGECGSLDKREHETMIFLAIVVFYKNRKAVNWMHSLSNMFLFSKLANVYLFIRADLLAGAIYIMLCLLHSVFCSEPIPVESEKSISYNGAELYNEMQKNLRISWVVFFYTAWSPDSKHVSPVFAELSDKFNLPNLRFVKFDLGRWPDEAQRFRINIHPTSRQLPTENCILAFDLNNLHQQCSSSMTKHEKQQLAEKNPVQLKKDE